MRERRGSASKRAILGSMRVARAGRRAACALTILVVACSYDWTAAPQPASGGDDAGDATLYDDGSACTWDGFDPFDGYFPDDGGVPNISDPCAPLPGPGGACNGLPQLGGVVTPTCSSAAAPGFGGGTVLDGIYTLTSAAAYGQCPTLNPEAQTLYVCGSLWRFATTQGSASTWTASATPASPTTISLDFTCGGVTPPVLTYSYTFNGTNLSLFFTTASYVIEDDYLLH
jgi:hypothetical protein